MRLLPAFLLFTWQCMIAYYEVTEMVNLQGAFAGVTMEMEGTVNELIAVA